MANQENLPVKKEKAPVPIVDGKFAPTDFDGLWRLATVMTSTEMVPVCYQNKPADAFVAMQMGMELGMSFMASLQSIAVVQGKPTVYADGVTGLIQGKGHLEWMEEGFKIGDKEVDPADLPANLDEWPKNLKAYCHMKRKGQDKVYKGSFSVSDAIRMGKWNKATKKGKRSIWQQWPARMLQWRARTFPSRDGFSDDLKGLSIYEEVIDYDADLTPANGHYELKDEPQSSDSELEGFLESWVIDNNLDEALVGKFIEESAAVTDSSREDIIKGAMADSNFLHKFNTWVSANGYDVPPAVNNQEEKEECRCGTCPECVGDIGQVPDDGDPMGIDDQEPDHEPIEALRDQLFVALESGEYDGVDYNEHDYVDLLDEYLEYVAELTKKPQDYYIGQWLEKGYKAWVQYFLGYIASKEAQKTPEQKDDKKPEQKPLPKAAEKKSFKAEWIGKIGTDFASFVKDNAEKFDPAVVGLEEYEAAKDKWVKLVYKRTKESWPLTYFESSTVQDADKPAEPEPKADIEFPKQTVKQRFAEMSINNPTEMKKALDKLKFANGGLSDGAMERAMEECKVLIGEEMTK